MKGFKQLIHSSCFLFGTVTRAGGARAAAGEMWEMRRIPSGPSSSPKRLRKSAVSCYKMEMSEVGSEVSKASSCVVNREKMMRSDGSISVCYCPFESFLRFAAVAIHTRTSFKGAEKRKYKVSADKL